LILLFLLRTIKDNRYKLLLATCALTALSTVWMAALYTPDLDPLRVYYGTDTRAAGFLVGAMLAMIWSPSASVGTSGSRFFEAAGWAGLFAVLILYNKLNEFQPFLYRGGTHVAALASALLIVGASCPGTRIGRLLDARVLRWIGSRSYSIYLWHWPVMMLTRPGFDIELPDVWIRAGQMAVTFLLAELSYHWVERPVRERGFAESIRTLQVSVRRRPLPQKLGLGAGVVSASLLLIWQGTLHQATASAPVEESLARQNTPSPAVIHHTATQPAAPSPQPTLNIVIPSPSTPAPDLPRVTLIGDSIMQGAAPMIEDVLGEDIYIDAARKRKMEDVPVLVQTLYREGHLSPVIVIHLGSNRPFEDSVFDDVMEALLAHDVQRAIFINVHRPIGWEYYVNQKFAKGVARWPQAELIDWDAMAHHEQGWFIKDQTHLSYYGSEGYVDAIKQALEAKE
jgi:hypothetical protein